MNIPALFPDEYILGWRGRIQFFNHFPSMVVTGKRLRSWYQHHGDGQKSLGSRTAQAFLLAKASGLPETVFFQRHTLIPFLRPFDPVVPVQDGSALHDYLITYAFRVGKKGAWYCESCINQDLEKYGMSYWHREHQLQGVDWCYLHGSALMGLESLDAFNHEPDIARARDRSFAFWPSHLEDAAPVVQRYAAIAKAILNRSACLSHPKLVAMIEHQYLAQRSAGSCLLMQDRSNAMHQDAMPEDWFNRFFESAKYNSPPFNDLKRIFDREAPPTITERYVLALALLFSSAGTAIVKMEQSNQCETPICKFDQPEHDPWWGPQILREYAQNGGCHQGFAESCGMDARIASQALLSHNLPNLTANSEAERAALASFFLGKSLEEACGIHGVDSIVLEKILREACRYFGAAVKIMSGVGLSTEESTFRPNLEYLIEKSPTLM
ncbi:hypothetical protein IGB42_01609 [Andreprevotia sp. IGB-42]|uniref:TniQ family protein n=1 Tax=Andreprevotia sp. IGB-42 TaxID=2497473 RepID=UPI00135BC0E6|nr:TniQ family protein [Andreprevotia sp. IGB-42]KAF0813930.1 hypothetical protein IGB42_01609 [Andreprevotia sp. IGB-42]